MAEKTTPKTKEATPVEKTEAIRIKKNYLVIGVIAILAIAAFFFFYLKADNSSSVSEIVSEGSNVEVRYTLTSEDGKVLDTNYEDVAKSGGLYNPQRDYTPLSFQVGAGAMIKGFEQNVLGMKIGEKKSFTVSPEEAYGSYDSSKVKIIPRVEVINKTETIPRNLDIDASQFKQAFGSDPVIGETYTNSQIPWNLTVKKIENSKVTLSVATSKGSEVSLPGLPWKSKVINLNATSIVLQHSPTNGQIIETSLGSATVELTKKEIKIKVNPVLGATINLQTGPVSVKEFNETSIVLDTNSPLAGKNLKFDVEVLSISA